MSESKKILMEKAVKKAREEGNASLANEITANVMVGTTMLIVFVVMLLCLVLNEVGVFTVDKTAMRLAVLIGSIIHLPMTIVNSITVGTKSWAKWPLMLSLILVCGVLSSILGHNVTLIMVFPMVVSLRYFDKKYTLQVAVVTELVFTLACFVNAILAAKGLATLNLNMIKHIDVNAVGSLKDINLRIIAEEYGDLSNYFGKYVLSLYLNDFMPRCIIFICLSISCQFVADRGKKMIEMQAEQSQKSARIETELSLATNIQANMLPRIFPAFPQRNEFDIFASMTPAKEVGGDFYDFFMIDEYHLATVVADVSGKGIPAALFMVIAKTLIKDHTASAKEPGDVFTEVNNLLCESNSENLFVTAFEGVLDLRTGEFRYVNAGHEMPFICKKGGKFKAQKIKPSFVLSGLENMKYSSGEFKLEPGDKFFQYTDGVTEATNSLNKLYGMKRLEDVLNENVSKKPSELLPSIKEDIDKFVGEAPQFDDITMLAFEFKEYAKEIIKEDVNEG